MSKGSKYLGLTANRLAEIASDLEAENDGLREELAKWEWLAAGIKLPEYPVTQFQPKDAERATITLSVRTLDRAPIHGTGGELVPLDACDPKGVAAKLLEEAAESYGAWQIYAGADSDFMRGLTWGPQLADELADVITAACDLAKVCGLDLQAALDRNEFRQIERGRVDG